MTSSRLPIPLCCDHCKSKTVAHKSNAEIYGQEFGKWPYIWHCESCNASVGCHPGTNIPLGRMADRHTRRLRHDVHEIFDRLWKERYMSREKAYQWLAFELGIELEQCHIAWLSKEQLKKAKNITQVYLESFETSLKKRKVKNETKLEKQRRKEFEANKLEFEKHRKFKSSRRRS
jgi:zinc-finger-containing domain